MSLSISILDDKDHRDTNLIIINIEEQPFIAIQQLQSFFLTNSTVAEIMEKLQNQPLFTEHVHWRKINSSMVEKIIAETEYVAEYMGIPNPATRILNSLNPLGECVVHIPLAIQLILKQNNLIESVAFNLICKAFRTEDRLASHTLKRIKNFKAIEPKQVELEQFVEACGLHPDCAETLDNDRCAEYYYDSIQDVPKFAALNINSTKKAYEHMEGDELEKHNKGFQNVLRLLNDQSPKTFQEIRKNVCNMANEDRMTWENMGVPPINYELDPVSVHDLMYDMEHENMFKLEPLRKFLGEI